jgi:hypothetical protein
MPTYVKQHCPQCGRSFTSAVVPDTCLFCRCSMEVGPPSGRTIRDVALNESDAVSTEVIDT